MEVQGKRALVAGLARSGIAAARLLHENGARVSVYDQKTEMQGAREALADLPLSWHLGEEPEALARAHDLVVISPGIPWDAPWLNAARRAKIPVIAELELGYLFCRGRVIAITGTNGKTTTTTLTGEIFKNAGKLTFVVGNIGSPISAAAERTHTEDVVVAEVSSFQLEGIREFHPDVSAVLNITEDHLNRHGTMEEYIRLKERVFENQRGPDIAVLNWDDPIVKAMAKRVPCRAVYFSRKGKPPSGAWVEDGRIVLGAKGEGAPVCDAREVGIPGAHNLENALCAAAIAWVSQVPPPVIRHTLRTFMGVEHRLEFVRELDGVRYVNDSKGTNVDAAVKAVEAMDRPTALIAGGYDKKTDFAPFAAAIVAGKITSVTLIGETAGQIEAALKAAGYGAPHRAHTMKEAVETARAQSRQGGNVLLSPACASFDMYADYEERGRDFKAIVSALV